jgi:hypothetical protein
MGPGLRIRFVIYGFGSSISETALELDPDSELLNVLNCIKYRYCSSHKKKSKTVKKIICKDVFNSFSPHN